MRDDDNEFCCNWPGCFAACKGKRKPRGWAHVGYTMCCPEHADALMAADMKIEDGWCCGPGYSAPNIGYEVLSEKGQCFIGAFENIPDDEVCDSGTLPPDCLPQLRRMAAAAGVKLLDWTKPGGSPGLRFLAEA